MAIQKVHYNLGGLYALEQFIGTEYELIFNDREEMMKERHFFMMAIKSRNWN